MITRYEFMVRLEIALGTAAAIIWALAMLQCLSSCSERRAMERARTQPQPVIRSVR